jgi:hypothetical protein
MTEKVRRFILGCLRRPLLTTIVVMVVLGQIGRLFFTVSPMLGWIFSVVAVASLMRIFFPAIANGRWGL